ncbi:MULTISPECIES: hypothetical protein [Vibrio harveyi group]|uniref:hypothetical protein n=1 Tax=Vibrio harveyi group TaxID=717610 RepID=UPI0004729BD5|nr:MULTISPECIES: hypothetical protein [Vibrio harveyi group]MBO0179736.1 hypothetical protein [Vibrio parahaemolyticus]MDF5359955.1 hypothetical protein [Vibrio parahaemolyticus]MDG2754360.1 hypothetical protein [Vibrio parahaemolyticus]MDG2763771.1 hypothetical protein [Vibrio parahaemolyticus]UDY85970.1 hypothetical protein LJY22_23390 [Vibrio diabolicus]
MNKENPNSNFPSGKSGSKVKALKNTDKIDANRRRFLRKSVSYSAAATVGVAAVTTSPPANAFFITAAKIYGELSGLACRLPTIMSFEFSADYIAELWGSMNTGSQNTMLMGYDKKVEVKAEADKIEVARQSEPSPRLCAFQEIGFTQQKYQYRDTQIVNQFCLEPPPLSNEFRLKPGFLDIKTLIDSNARSRKISAEERNELMTSFRAIGGSLAKRKSYTNKRFADYQSASDEVRRILAFQGLNIVSALLAGDERYASNLQSINTFASNDWRQELIAAGGETGMYAEASRQLGQLIHNEHQALLAEERLMVLEALSAVQSLATIQKKRRSAS